MIARRHIRRGAGTTQKYPGEKPFSRCFRRRPDSRPHSHEIGELPLAKQAKLLRVLEQGTMQPVGSDRVVTVDVRVVAATHRDLARSVDQDHFRFDLFHRLAVVHLRIPPLRERPEDLRALVRSFYEGRSVEPGEIGGNNLARLTRHAWPGNVRELRNVLERAWVLSGAGAQFAELNVWLREEPIKPGEGRSTERVDTTVSFKEGKDQVLEQFERQYLSAVFAEHDYNVTKAADHAGLSRRHMRELLHKYGISKP